MTSDEPTSSNGPGGRRSVRTWAVSLQVAFNNLPATTTRATNARDVCRIMVTLLEDMRRSLIPTPSLEIDLLFATYLDALLALYRECPQRRERALHLHNTANMHGLRFEQAINRALRAEQP